MITELASLRPKSYGYFTDDSENKKTKGTKKCRIKRKLKFEDYKHSLEETQLENKINQLEKKVGVDSLRKNHKECIKNNKLILKSQQRFRIEEHIIFTEEVKKAVLNANECSELNQYLQQKHMHMERAKT